MNLRKAGQSDRLRSGETLTPGTTRPTGKRAQRKKARMGPTWSASNVTTPSRPTLPQFDRPGEVRRGGRQAVDAARLDKSLTLETLRPIHPCHLPVIFRDRRSGKLKAPRRFASLDLPGARGSRPAAGKYSILFGVEPPSWCTVRCWCCCLNDSESHFLTLRVL
jgi:hypothetical protein